MVVGQIDRLAELDEELKQEKAILRKVLEIVRKAKKGKGARTLRECIAVAIRTEFEFTEYLCRGCGEWLPTRKFQKDGVKGGRGAFGPKGRRSQCEVCVKLKRMDEYWANREHKCKQAKGYRERRRERQEAEEKAQAAEVMRKMLGDPVRCGNLGCLTDECEHWGKGECSVVLMSECKLGRRLDVR